MRAPTFFLVGAPKCGTTSLNDYLRQHPDIFIPERKELHYFGRDLRFFKSPRPKKHEYLNHFAAAQPHQQAGEASVWYLYSRQAAGEIHSFCPDARIIIMLRNPVDMMHSLHSQFIYESNENVANFGSALALEEERRRGQKLPPRTNFREGLLYRRVARYAEQVRRYLALFGRENVHVVDFDEFSQETPRVYAEVLEFLGADPSFPCEFRVRNPNKQVLSTSLQSFLNNPSPGAVSLARRLIPMPLRRAIIDRLKRANARPASRPPLDEQLRARLEREFAFEVDLLSQLLDRDFTPWLGTRKPAPIPVG